MLSHTITGLLVGSLNLYFALVLLRGSPGKTELVLAFVMAVLGVSYVGGAVVSLLS